MAITLDDLNLPDDLVWTDEIEFTPITQSVEIALSGSVIIQEAEQSAGQPMTLAGTANSAWAARSLVKALAAKLSPSLDMTLTLHDARVFTVRWDHRNRKPIESQPVVAYSDPADDDQYTLVLHVIILAAL
jgi:hypothetical protein